jgi:hypothetical protein
MSTAKSFPVLIGGRKINERTRCSYLGTIWAGLCEDSKKI